MVVAVQPRLLIEVLARKSIESGYYSQYPLLYLFIIGEILFLANHSDSFA